MYFVTSASSITYQKTLTEGFSKNMLPLNASSLLIQPEYSAHIEPTLLRRMGQLIRMASYCSLDCLRQSAVKEPGSILVGTGLGCMTDTEKFLNNINVVQEGALSPTAFIHSTHNTIAGQLSLLLNNNNYNMTHTQNSMSFDYALQDGLLCLDEGSENILVGGADEHLAVMDTLLKNFHYTELLLASGVSFFTVSKNSGHAKAKITNTSVCGGILSLSKSLDSFMESSAITPADIDLVLYSSIDRDVYPTLGDYFQELPVICNYLNYCGTYLSNSAFAVHLAIDILGRKKVKFEFMNTVRDTIKKVLIINNLNPANLGLILIGSIET